MVLSSLGRGVWSFSTKKMGASVVLSNRCHAADMDEDYFVFDNSCADFASFSLRQCPSEVIFYRQIGAR